MLKYGLPRTVFSLLAYLRVVFESHSMSWSGQSLRTNIIILDYLMEKSGTNLPNIRKFLPPANPIIAKLQ